MVLDSGVISHIVQKEEHFPISGTSNKIVALPNGSTTKATHMVQLPFPQLAAAVWQAHVLPSIATNSLISVQKLDNAGYTTIFHHKSQGVTVHRSDTISICQQCKPVLQGWRYVNRLWRLGRSGQQIAKSWPKDSAANVYSLPTIGAVIKYLHATAGFPMDPRYQK